MAFPNHEPLKPGTPLQLTLHPETKIPEVPTLPCTTRSHQQVMPQRPAFVWDSGAGKQYPDPIT